MAADQRAPGSLVRKTRAFRVEFRKAIRQPSLYVYLLIVVAVAAAWGPFQHSLEKEQEAKRRPVQTHSFGEPEPAAETETRSAEERGANGFLLLASSLRAGATVAAVLILLFASSLLAGERTMGTCRLLLTRPITRWDVVVAKAALLVVVVLGFIAAVAITGFVLGFGYGGYGDYVDVRHGLVAFEAGFLAEVAFATLVFAPLGLIAVAWLGLFVSSVFGSAATAVTVSALAALSGVALNLMLSTDAASLNFLSYVARYPAILESFARGLSEHQFGWNLELPRLLVPAASALVFLLGALIMFRYRDIHE